MASHNAQPYKRFLAASIPNLAINARGSSDRGPLHAYVGTLAADHGYTLAQDDQINFTTLPAGFTPLFVQVQTGALGTGVTLALTANDGTNRTILAATSVASATSTIVPAAYSTPLAVACTLVGTLAGGNPADNVAATVVVYGTFE